MISDDEYNHRSDDVFVVFLTKRAHDLDWYRSFSPRQADIQCSCEDCTALCSHVVAVEKKCLGNWMGAVTSNELVRITDEVKKAKGTDLLPWMSRSKDRDDGLQIA